MSNLTKKIKTYFVGTANELRTYKHDKFMSLLLISQTGFTYWFIKEPNMINAPIALDVFVRGAYSLTSFIWERKQLRDDLTKHLTPKQANTSEVKATVYEIFKINSKGYTPPGIIGLLRQKGRHLPLMEILEEKQIKTETF